MTGARSPVLVIANQGDDDLGVLGPCLSARSLGWTVVHRETFEAWPDPATMLQGIELLIPLGSDWSVYSDHVAKPVRAELAVIECALARELPIFGICFGGQMLACALGGRVGPIARPEIGWHPVASTDESIVPSGVWAQWHFDGFEVPAGAQCIASSPSGPQAFAIGPSLGLQFHPEVDERIMGRWAAGDTSAAQLAAVGVTAEDLRAQCRANAAANLVRSAALLGGFLDRRQSSPAFVARAVAGGDNKPVAAGRGSGSQHETRNP
jgi:GMP synthase-like glutamine amidotransferase